VIYNTVSWDTTTVLQRMVYSRHVKLTVPQGPYGSLLCCHEGHTRQLTEVI